MAIPQASDGMPAIDLDALTPEQAWQLWRPVSNEYIRRIKAGQDAAIDAVAAELGIPLEVGAIAAQADEEQETQAAEWIEALVGETLQ